MQGSTTANLRMRHRQKTKYSKKFQDIKVRIINFYGKTWAAICRAIDALKSRYHKQVRLLSQKPIGAGLFQGQIQVQ